MWLGGLSYNACSMGSDGWATRVYLSTLKQVAGVDKRYGNYGTNGYTGVANWGSGIVAVGYERYSSTNSNARLRVDMLDYYGNLKDANRYGSSSYRSYGNDAVYTGNAGGYGFGVVGYTTESLNQGVAAQVSDNGRSYCTIKIPLK